MSARASHIMLVLSAFLAGLVVFLAVFLYATGQLGTRAPSAGIGGPFALTDQNGKPITDADLKGKPSLVFFGYTHCPDVCPTTLFDISEVMRALGPDADRAAALFISVDPDRDTPAVLKDYLSSFDPHVRAATGDQANLDKVEKEYRVYSRKRPLDPKNPGGNYAMDHSSVIYLVGPDGKLVNYYDEAISPSDLAADLKQKMV